MLDVVVLANEGALSQKVMLEAWRAGTTPCHATSAKARNAQAKILAERGHANVEAIVIDCARKWLGARKTQDQETSSVAWLLVNALLDTAVDAAITEFKRWTPVVLKLGKSGALGGSDWVDCWFGTYIWKMDIEGHKDEHTRASKERDKAKKSA